jgi:hypothetical protein
MFANLLDAHFFCLTSTIGVSPHHSSSDVKAEQVPCEIANSKALRFKYHTLVHGDHAILDLIDCYTKSSCI